MATDWLHDSHEKLGKVLGREAAIIPRMRMDPAASGHRSPPGNWPELLAQRARQRVGELEELESRLLAQASSAAGELPSALLSGKEAKRFINDLLRSPADESDELGRMLHGPIEETVAAYEEARERRDTPLTAEEKAQAMAEAVGRAVPRRRTRKRGADDASTGE